MQNKEKGKPYGFIKLEDRSTLFCPERVFEGRSFPNRAPFPVSVVKIQRPATASELYVADLVRLAALDVD